MLKERNIAVSIILCFITGGIYLLYWMAKLNNESRYAANVDASEGTTGGKVILLTFVTCGIYGIYWNYKMGKRMHTALTNAGVQAEDRSALYLVLSLLILDVINFGLIQNDLNNIIKSSGNVH